MRIKQCIQYQRRHRRVPRRQGLALMMVLVALALSVSLIAMVTRTSLMTQRRLQSEIALRQVSFLLHAGNLRAAQQYGLDNNYNGEIWEIPADVLGAESARITIQPDASLAPDAVSFLISVEYPRDSLRSIRRSQSCSVQRKQP